MGVVWLVVAVLCVAAGVALLVVDRRRSAAPPPPSVEPHVPAPREPEPDGDLFTPEALPRHPENGS
ncbi:MULTISPECIES: hypothetical protein [unclassified Pseudonocardia]|jgi:hypothetical protein|uniref:hypothetical protein n=1 Tax=unclassified Pseudonocardia TaxID=2619320 RepID=UPI00095FBE79|nr:MULTISPECIES: hypothetical protein [unclassified Pseudonocardia]MBN9098251.1 hypothetical protein [Pseudonocardia sp.]OJY52504.1 MAG: hypothetical protein BGP03_31740 [Pseudonocardia sp. 73-21]